MPGTVLGSKDIAKSLASLSLHSMKENIPAKMCIIVSVFYEEKFKKVRKRENFSGSVILF